MNLFDLGFLNVKILNFFVVGTCFFIYTERRSKVRPVQTWTTTSSGTSLKASQLPLSWETLAWYSPGICKFSSCFCSSSWSSVSRIIESSLLLRKAVEVGEISLLSSFWWVSIFDVLWEHFVKENEGLVSWEVLQDVVLLLVLILLLWQEKGVLLLLLWRTRGDMCFTEGENLRFEARLAYFDSSYCWDFW